MHGVDSAHHLAQERKVSAGLNFLGVGRNPLVLGISRHAWLGGVSGLSPCRVPRIPHVIRGGLGANGREELQFKEAVVCGESL
jgi:hypothetical protein